MRFLHQSRCHKNAIKFNFHVNASKVDHGPWRLTRLVHNFTWETIDTHVNASFPFISSMGDRFIRTPITPFLSRQRCWFTFVCRISFEYFDGRIEANKSLTRRSSTKVVLPLFSNLFLFPLAYSGLFTHFIRVFRSHHLNEALKNSKKTYRDQKIIDHR